MTAPLYLVAGAFFSAAAFRDSTHNFSLGITMLGVLALAVAILIDANEEVRR